MPSQNIVVLALSLSVLAFPVGSAYLRLEQCPLLACYRYQSSRDRGLRGQPRERGRGRQEGGKGLRIQRFDLQSIAMTSVISACSHRSAIIEQSGCVIIERDHGLFLTVRKAIPRAVVI